MRNAGRPVHSLSPATPTSWRGTAPSALWRSMAPHPRRVARSQELMSRCRVGCRLLRSPSSSRATTNNEPRDAQPVEPLREQPRRGLCDPRTIQVTIRGPLEVRRMAPLHHAHRAVVDTVSRLKTKVPVAMRARGGRGELRPTEALPPSGRLATVSVRPLWRVSAVRGCCQRAPSASLPRVPAHSEPLPSLWNHHATRSHLSELPWQHR